MNWRLDDIPVFKQSSTTVDAANYNQVRIALNRLGDTISIPLTGLRKLELIIDQDTWVVIDNDLNEIPILAWTNFQTEGRDTLHEPVRCELKTYHMHALVILEQVAEFMEKELAKRVSELQNACEIENVISIKKE